MDFNKFDQRGKAEIGQAFPILHPETGEPIGEGDRVSKFILRGPSAPSVQEAERKRQLAAMVSATQDQPSAPSTMGTAHDELVEAAVPFVVGFENVELDGKPATAADARRFLNLTFPRMDKDADGKLFIANKTFAQQVLLRASELEKLLGNV
jgi:pimeloyl-ACP methyl ester carboxylesterase